MNGTSPLRGGLNTIVPPAQASQDAGSYEPRMRAQEGGGYLEERPSNAGPAIDQKWWDETALEILRRLPGGPGAGEGPPPKVVTLLSDWIQAALDYRRANSEAALRKSFATPTGSTLDLREAVVSRLVSLVAAESARGLRPLPQTPAPKADAPQMGSSESPPPSALRRGGNPRCHRCKGADPERAFKRTENERTTAHAWFRQELARTPKLEKEFDRRIPLDIEAWRDNYEFARGVAQTGGSEDLDDDYRCPGVGEPSSRVIGEAVHAKLHSRYMNDSEFINHTLVIDDKVLWALNLNRARPAEYIRDVPDIDRRPDELGALAFAMGLRGSMLKPDVANLTLGQIIEIKPVRGFHCGILQIWQYTHNFNLAKFYDEKTKAGPHKGKPRLEPGWFPARLLAPFFLAEELTGPSRARWGDLIATPYMHEAAPGVIFYTLSKGDSKSIEEVLRTVLKGVAIAAGIVIAVVVAAVAAIVIAEVAAGVALAEAGAGALAAGSAGGVALAEAGSGALAAGGAQAVAGTSAVTGAAALQTVQNAAGLISSGVTTQLKDEAMRRVVEFAGEEIPRTLAALNKVPVR